MQNKSNIFSYIAVFGLALVLVAPFTVSAITDPGFIPEVKDSSENTSASASVPPFVPEVKNDSSSNTSAGPDTSSFVPTVKDGGSNTSGGGSSSSFVPTVKDSGSNTSAGGSSSSSFVPTVKDGGSNTSADPVVDSGSSSVSPVTSGSRSGSRSGGSSSVTTAAAAPSNIIINLGGGVANSCPYIVGFILPGANNDAENVARLQMYLNEKLNLSLTINGTYDLATQDAVKRLQTENKGAILAPWGQDVVSGNVYLTTVGFINEEKCNDGSLAKAQLVAKNTVTTVAPVVTGDAGTVVETPAPTETAPIIGSNTTDTNVAAIGTNTGIFTRFFNWIKNIFN